MDAPLMAGPDEAAAGTLDIVVGGDKEDYDKATELFDAYCQSYKYVGPSGTGHLIKLAINFISLTEALMFAQLFPLMDKMGFDPKDLFDVFEDSVLKNWTSTFYTKKYMDRNYRLDFALALGTKDLSYVKRMYEEYNVPAFRAGRRSGLLPSGSGRAGKGPAAYRYELSLRDHVPSAGDEVGRERKNQEGMEKGCYIGR